MPTQYPGKFNALADFTPTMIWVSDVDKAAIWFNKAWYAFTQRTEDQERGFGWAKSIHPDDYPQFLEIYTQAFDALESFSVDYRLRRHDGNYGWIQHAGTPLYVEDGTFDGYISCCTDIQARKESEHALSERIAVLEHSHMQFTSASKRSASLERTYETILSSTPDFVYTFEFNESGHVFGYANEGLLKMFGRSYEETVGKTFLEIGYEPWHADMHNKEIDLVRATKKQVRGAVPFNGTFGRRIYDYIFSPVFNQDGEVEKIAGITRDVTDRHNTEELLKQNEQALLRESKRKDEFLAMLAHELRNPLAPITAATEIMSLSDYDVARVRKYSQVIERQVKHMVDLIDDLLDVSRVTRGLVEIAKTPQDLAPVITSSIEQVRPMIDAKHQKLNINVLPERQYVLGDEKRLIQIIANVLGNAAKYTQEHGNIDINLWTENASVYIAISDDGIGISEDDQAIIFELFAQAKRSSDRSQGGLGIGLALVKSLLQLHGGTVSCYSEGLGKGSRFVIELPLLESSADVKEEVEAFDVLSNTALSIYVVDDNEDAATSLAEILKLFGHQVRVAHDSTQALASIAHLKPDLCILDIGLPEIDGYEMARIIRANPDLAGIYLIAVTGYGQFSDKQNALASGFDMHFVKPVDYKVLCQSIEGLSKRLF